MPKEFNITETLSNEIDLVAKAIKTAIGLNDKMIISIQFLNQEDGRKLDYEINSKSVIAKNFDNNIKNSILKISQEMINIGKEE